MRAKTMSTSASGALVIQRFCPVITQWSPSRTAFVVSDEGSEPASGSVSANDATTSPDARRGSHSCCCSAVPPASSTCPAMPLLVPNSERSDGVVQPSSIASSTSSLIERPMPPNSSGIAKP